MILIKNILPKSIKNKIISFGLFLCPYCLKEVEKRLSNGKKQKSCGCIHGKLISKSTKGKKKSEEHIRKNSESHIGLQIGNKNGMYGKKGVLSPNYGKKRTEETKQKIGLKHKNKIISEKQKENQSKIMKGRYIGKNNPMYGIHRFGSNSPSWQGGKSFEIYPQEFKQIRKIIYERDNYICQNPECNINIGYYKRLDCHHIDYDKKNNNLENLITLCVSCHMKTNVKKKKRQYFIEFYQNIMIYKLTT